MESAASLKSMVPASAKRMVYEFPIPSDLANDHVKETIGVVKLTSEEQEQCSQRAQDNPFRMAHEWSKCCLREVDGRPINRAEGEDETIWKAMDPQLRELVANAYNKLHMPKPDTVKDFLAGMRIKAG